MYPLARVGRLAAVGALVLTAGCASMNVNSYVERGYDLNRFHTYAWSPAPAAATGDPRLDSNPFFDEQVRAEVEVQLARRGFERTARMPDLLVHYHASMTQRIETRDLDQQYGSCDKGNCRADVYDAGTILIDLVDPYTDKVIWRGWAEGAMDGVVDNQAWMEATINKAVTRIFERLPRLL
jgi:hypothetical protein